MARYIDSEALTEEIKSLSVMLGGENVFKTAKESVLRIIDEQPTADVAEVVRCRNCLHKINYKGRAMCTLYAEEALGVWYGLNATRDEHFCSYGKRSDI